MYALNGLIDRFLRVGISRFMAVSLFISLSQIAGKVKVGIVVAEF